HRIIGTDISPKAISIAEKNVKSAGLAKYIDLQVKPFQQYTEAPAPKGVLMSNPPYGERIKIEEIEALYDMIGERLKHIFMGYDAYILSYKKECFDKVGLKPSRRFPLFNGALECEMREYEIFAGKLNQRPREERRERPTREENRERHPREEKREYRPREEKREYRPREDRREQHPKEDRRERPPREERRERPPREERIRATSKSGEKKPRPPFKAKGDKGDKRGEAPKKPFFDSYKKDSQ
ncbi:MAG: RNA methyltransferase, partial [Dysgonamonadaceae bacterium]|nr:RNA methyltransferase [Dysgonamonadaceae bacterium]